MTSNSGKSQIKILYLGFQDWYKSWMMKRMTYTKIGGGSSSGFGSSSFYTKYNIFSHLLLADKRKYKSSKKLQILQVSNTVYKTNQLNLVLFNHFSLPISLLPFARPPASLSWLCAACCGGGPSLPGGWTGTSPRYPPPAAPPEFRPRWRNMILEVPNYIYPYTFM